MWQGRPDHEVAIGLPDTPRFRSLVATIDGALSQLGIGVLLVSEAGTVEVLLEPQPRVQLD
jgi:hypothetical protein